MLQFEKRRSARYFAQHPKLIANRQLCELFITNVIDNILYDTVMFCVFVTSLYFKSL